jgi:ferric-dicitrate binding protein FerR (iron transport regulator)
VGDELIRVPCSDIVAVGTLLLIIFIAPVRMASNRYACVRDLQERKEATLLESFLPTATTQSQIAVRRTRSALHVRVFSGAIRFNRHNTQAHPVAMTTIVTTGQVQLSHVDATICVRAQGDRTSIAVLDGVVQVLALAGKERSVASGRDGATERGVFAMKLRAGDRAEIFKRGSDLVVRLESGDEVAGVCPLRWTWGFAVLERWVG